MDVHNPVVKLCIAGSQAEFKGQPADALERYLKAWKIASDDYEACIAAHYVARFQQSAEDTLRWNQEALNRANAADPRRVKNFYPSLYLNMGHSHEILGNQVEALHYYELAAQLGHIHHQ